MFTYTMKCGCFFFVCFFNYRQQLTQIQGSFQASTLQFQQALDRIEWNQEAVQDLQQAVLNGPQLTFCTANDSVSNLLC